VLEAAAKADPDGPAARLTAAVPPDVYLVNRGEKAEVAALALACRLRQAGVAVELDGSASAFGKQFKRADRCGASWALVLGDEESDAGVVQFKPLRAKAEAMTLPIDDIPALKRAFGLD